MTTSQELSALLEDASTLISIRSANPPGNERAVAAWLRRRLTSLATVDVRPVAKGRSNFFATFDFGPGPTFLLCTHTDVVPVADESQWTATVREGRLVGRGACDAKGALAAMIGACLRLRSHPAGLGGRVILAALADEEAGALGARTLVESGFSADAAIIGEPTSNEPVLASRGAVRMFVEFRGMSAHSSSPANGRNAIYAAAHFIGAVEEHQSVLARRNSMSSCAATVVNGGSRMNVIPDSCTVLVDRRVGPAETCASAAGEITDLATSTVERYEGIEFTTGPAGAWLEPFSIPSENPFAAALLDELVRDEPGPVFTGGTDAPYLINAGIPTAILGPGSLSMAHTAAEEVMVEELAEALAIYERICRRILGRSAGVEVPMAHG